MQGPRREKLRASAISSGAIPGSGSNAVWVGSLVSAAVEDATVDADSPESGIRFGQLAPSPSRQRPPLAIVQLSSLQLGIGVSPL